MMLEAGQPEARGVAYIAETKKIFPNKPLRYVWNSHPHSDHTGGLPALVAEDVTIVTQQNNKEFFEKALNTPRTLLNDTLAKSPKKVKIETIGEKKVYSDGSRTVEFYHVYPTPHSNGLTIAFIPEGEDPVPGRLHAAGRGTAGQRSHQGAAAGRREAEPRLRAVHPGAQRQRATDQGRSLEGRRK